MPRSYVLSDRAFYNTVRVEPVISYHFSVLVRRLKEHPGHEIVDLLGLFRVGLFLRITVIGKNGNYTSKEIVIETYIKFS